MTTQAPPPPGGSQHHQSKGKRFAIVAILLVVIAGLGTAAGLVMVNRSDDTASDAAQYVVMDTPLTTPVFEPRDAAGNDPFFPLDTQLLTYQEEVEEQIDAQMAIAQANAEPGESVIRPAFDVAALDEAVKTGLYGGTEENTCDPERLISFLYANPDIGEAWAKVQGIQFSEIADYIRSLEVRVLAAPVNVLNHGFDFDTGSAYEIDTVLDAGTAVLVDENGDIRTRCYCGNPIKPKPPQHLPPRCIVYGAFVSVVPGGVDRRDGAPTDVLLTGRQTTLGDGITWIEVTWGSNENETGWVRSDDLRKHYCPTPTNDRYCPGPDATPVWHTPDTTDRVGQVTGKVRTVDTTLDIFAPLSPAGGVGSEVIVNDFMLIRFKEGAPSAQNSAWVELADLNQDSSQCERIRQCVDTEGPVWERASGGLLPNPGGIQWVEFTGHFIGDPLVTFAEVRLNDGTGAYGWISNFYSPLADADCERVYDCVETGYLFETPEQELPDYFGQLNNIDVDILGGPENGRMQVQVGTDGPIGWVEQSEFFDGHNNCDGEPACYTLAGPAWTEFSTNGDSIPAQGPLMVTVNGARVFDGGPVLYEYINVGGTDYWINLFQFVPKEAADCEPEANPPECTDVRRDPGERFAPGTFIAPARESGVGIWDAEAGSEAAVVIGDLDPGDDEPGDDEPGDDEPGDRSECCVTALYLSRDVTDPSADLVPTTVLIVGGSEVDGVTWFETAGSRYFRQADIDPDACDQPECPQAYDRIGHDDIKKIAGSLAIETFEGAGGAARTLDTDLYPETFPGDEPVGDPATGECCVDQLYSAPNYASTLGLTSAVWVDMAAGPDGFDPAWFETTSGDYFPETDVVDGSECDRVRCPTNNDNDPGNTPADPSSDAPLPPGFDTRDEYIAVAQALGTNNFDYCCISGGVWDTLESIESDEDPTWTVENFPVVVTSQSGEFFEVQNVATGWVYGSQFLSLEDCGDDDDSDCPRTSRLGTQTDGENTYYICCIEWVSDNGTVEFVPVVLDDPAEGEVIAYVDASFCTPECPEDSTINVQTNECCVASEKAGIFEIVTLTGEARIGEDGEPEFKAENGQWYGADDFASSGRCEPNDDRQPCEGRVLATGECCERPNEVFQGQCVPPCATGQVRNANGECETPPTPACPTGQVRNANGVCEFPPTPACPVGQYRDDNGQCVTPACEDTDKDGVCNTDDNCESEPNEDQADRDQDGSGDKCDPCTDADQDFFCEAAGTPANDNCWDKYNPDQSDSDGDGVGDGCDDCPLVPGTGDDCVPDCPRTPAGAPGGDRDSDGICDSDDNCVSVSNPNQSDRDDRDGWGDVCDNCPDAYNPDQADNYGEPGVGDACETPPCPQASTGAPGADTDGDGVCDSDDNCDDTPNPGQNNSDQDEYGNACDLCPSTWSYNLDSDGDGRGDACDFCPGPNGNEPTANVPNPLPGYLYDLDVDGVNDSCFPLQ